MSQPEAAGSEVLGSTHYDCLPACPTDAPEIAGSASIVEQLVTSGVRATG